MSERSQTRLPSFVEGGDIHSLRSRSLPFWTGEAWAAKDERRAWCARACCWISSVLERRSIPNRRTDGGSMEGQMSMEQAVEG